MHKQSYICKAKSATFGDILKKEFTPKCKSAENVLTLNSDHPKCQQVCSFTLAKLAHQYILCGKWVP